MYNAWVHKIVFASYKPFTQRVRVQYMWCVVESVMLCGPYVEQLTTWKVHDFTL